MPPVEDSVPLTVRALTVSLRRGPAALGTVAVLLLSACSATAGEEGGAAPTPEAAPAPTTSSSPPPEPDPASEPRPALDVAVVAEGLDHPWDVAQAPDGTLLLDERGGGLTAVLPDGTVRELAADFGDLVATGDTGLMGLVLDPGFARDRRFYKIGRASCRERV